MGNLLKYKWKCLEGEKQSEVNTRKIEMTSEENSYSSPASQESRMVKATIRGVKSSGFTHRSVIIKRFRFYDKMKSLHT